MGNKRTMSNDFLEAQDKRFKEIDVQEEFVKKGWIARPDPAAKNRYNSLSPNIKLEDVMSKPMLRKLHLLDEKQEKYDAWVLDKVNEVRRIKRKLSTDLAEFAAGDKKFGMCTMLVTVNGVYFDQIETDPIYKYYVGWFLNTNVFAFNCILYKPGADKVKKINPDLKVRKVEMLPPWKISPRTEWDKHLNRSILTLIPDLNSFAILGNSMLFDKPDVDLLPSNKAFHEHSIKGQRVYVIPVIETEVLKTKPFVSFNDWQIFR